MAYTNIDDPSAFFQTALYTGNGSTVVTVTNDGNSDLQPDLLWFKRRNAAVSHVIMDTNGGANVTSGFGPTGYNITLNTNSTATAIADNTGVMTITDDGFTVKELSYTSGNVNTGTMCCWQWHCDAGDRITFSESGNNPGGVRQTNATAGMSIIRYTGTGANASCALAHGLGKAPEFVIFKRGNATNWWATYHVSTGVDYKLALQETAAKDSDGAFMNSTIPDATNIYVGGTSVHTNADGGTYLAYAWTSIQGYSKFGSYEGNSNADGPFIYTGFKPAFIIVKPIDIAEHWVIHDNKRDPFNKTYHYLFANETEAEAAGGTHHIDLLSNGFKIRTSNNNWNASSTVAYMAFAENPFVTSTGTPTTAR
jgi:hypothetical protein